MALGVAALCGCGAEERSYVPNASDVNVVPTMATRDVQTFISDSGYTRYHISAPLWQMFEEADDPYWFFPEGLELEQYDLNMRPESNVVCDTARYYSQRRLWQLDGNVVMVSTQRDTFLTQQLFWDQNAREVRSDSFIHIVREDRIIEGYGFVSNQNMTSYTVNRPTAILPGVRPGSQNTARRDTTETPEPVASAPAPAPKAASSAELMAMPDAPARDEKRQTQKATIQKITPVN